MTIQNKNPFAELDIPAILRARIKDKKKHNTKNQQSYLEKCIHVSPFLLDFIPSPVISGTLFADFDNGVIFSD